MSYLGILHVVELRSPAFGSWKYIIDFFIKSGVELFKEMELKGVDSVYLALDGSKWWACVDMVLTFLWLIPLCFCMINQ
jgi:hypothetical protein